MKLFMLNWFAKIESESANQAWMDIEYWKFVHISLNAMRKFWKNIILGEASYFVYY